MLRFLVFSDTHGVREPLYYLYKQYPNDGIIHLGDHYEDARWMLMHTDGHPVYAVKGNCDYGCTGPEEQLLELGGVKLLLMHGHRYGVKSGYGGALAEAKRQGANAVLFGHTHRPFMEERDGILMLNPGSLRNPNRDYAIIEIEENRVKGVLLHQYD